MIVAWKETDINDIIDCLTELMYTEHQLEPSRLDSREAANKYFIQIVKKVVEQGGQIFLSKKGTATTGVLIVYPEQNEIFEEAGRHLAIADIVVKAAFRKSGIGTALMKQAEIFAREKGLKEIRLYALYKNTTALQLYRNSGFREIGMALTKQLAPEK